MTVYIRTYWSYIRTLKIQKNPKSYFGPGSPKNDVPDFSGFLNWPAETGDCRKNPLLGVLLFWLRTVSPL